MAAADSVPSGAQKALAPVTKMIATLVAIAIGLGIAISLGLALVLPERVQPAQEWVLARPTGVGRALTAYRMPIEGRDEWMAAARRLA